MDAAPSLHDVLDSLGFKAIDSKERRHCKHIVKKDVIIDHYFYDIVKENVNAEECWQWLKDEGLYESPEQSINER